MASTYLTRTTGTPTNAKKWTMSLWVKGGATSNTQDVVHVGVSGSDEIMLQRYETNGVVSTKEDTSAQNTIWGVFNDNRVFRDPSAWQHWVHTFDSTQSTATDRYKVYVNGVLRRNEETFTSETTVPLNHEAIINKSGYTFTIGRRAFDSANYYEGLLSHVHFIDGATYDASTFGETDSSTGEWKINTSPTISDYGNNGFFILKDGNSVTDQSGKGNNFTVAGGTLTKTEDCPSNIFATFNPNYRSSNTANFYNGNTRVTGTDYTNQRTGGTLASNSGKFYFEAKAVGSTDFGGSTVGIYNYDGNNIIMNSNTWFGSSSDYIGFYCSSNVLKVITAGSHDNHGSVSVGDIIGCAFDIDNGYLYLSINGTWVNSGVPTSGSTGTGNVNRTGSHNYNFSGLLMGIAGGLQVTDAWQCNFGNGYFGTTAVSSAGTNASGNGIFEYDVPTGYTALSTKGLNL